MKCYFKRFLSELFLVVILSSLPIPSVQAKPKKPKLVAIFVVDQFAFHYLKKLRPYFKYGLRDLLDKGIYYANAYHPHAIPETTTGHSCLSTGALPKDHGAILNDWINDEYKTENYDEDHDPATAVFKNGSTVMPGKSPRKTVTDGLSDQLVLSSTNLKKCLAFSFALKSYPAIATATRLGKAFWFDDVSGGFTTSEAYFDELPAWVKDFNKKHKYSSMSSFTWKLQYPENSAAYQFPEVKNYDYASYPFSMIEKGTVVIDKSEKQPYKKFLQSPNASKDLLKFAQECLIQHTKKGNPTILMWVLLSNLDLLCHFYGPDCLETIDMIYHIDEQISHFMKAVAHRVGKQNCLFVLTADHGIPPIPEVAVKRGLTVAKRVMAGPLIEQANEYIKKTYDLDDIVKGYEPTSFKLNAELLASLDSGKKNTVINDLKMFLGKQPGIRKVWTREELEEAPYVPGQREYFYKTQIYPGRIGDLICMPQPYCQITHYEKGTSHMSPYEYDTHVPLVFYQKGRFERKLITEKIFMTQLAPTLARILNVNRPATGMGAILPGLGDL